MHLGTRSILVNEEYLDPWIQYVSPTKRMDGCVYWALIFETLFKLGNNLTFIVILTQQTTRRIT